MSGREILGRLAGVENLRSVDELKASFAAPWAQGGTAWIFFACLALAGLALLFYMRWQGRSRTARIILAAARALLFAALVLILAEPILTLKITSSPKPLFWIVVDGTDSMGIVDELTDAEREKLSRAAGIEEARAREKLPRMEYVRALLRKKDPSLLGRLEEKFRLQAFLFDRPDSARLLDPGGDDGPGEGDGIDAARVAEQLTAEGQVTAIGSALADLASRHATGSLAGILLASDFNQNAGAPAISAARRLGVPVYTLGIGPAASLDLKVDLQAPLLLKKAERSTLVATLRQTGLGGRSARLRLSSRRAPGPGGGSLQDAALIEERLVTLDGPAVAAEFSYTPADAGRFILEASAERLEGEVVDQNNRAEREVNILDDFLRLLFVEYEPTWEWRFIKEVFHRDKLVGLRGFRTFLRSADPKVRQTNSLFLPTMTPVRSEFFSSDVIFLGDLPASALSGRFFEMAREFVSKFGGGLVVLSGPRFGPGQLAGTPLEDMLPVVVDPDGRLRGDREFRLRLTPDAAQADFMKLGSSDESLERAWANLGPLPWYQPVARLHPLATCLAEHPTETCRDGKTPQPLIAIRRFGKGEVVYLGFNETWRLRRKHGELYYRQFWGQMIHRLGLSHALGSQKRFIVRTDRREYPADSSAILTVEACDANFEPLGAEKLPERKLSAELEVPGRPPGAAAQPIAVPLLREGVFEARFPVFAAGEHRLKVKDPVTGETVEATFAVTSLSAERRVAVRNSALEEEIVQATGGARYDLESVGRLPDEVKVPVKKETAYRVIPLWDTWLCFGLVVALCLGEWLVRKLVNLS